ncbi:MAG: hypothetical protein E6Q77_02970 [Rhizobium sp.]|nr:MAG: hypothetical protein E6Q77_02970 [Rhizobium sp.]
MGLIILRDLPPDCIASCIAAICKLRETIHKDPVKTRVALLAADPPDNTATQPFPGPCTRLVRCLQL